MSKLIKVDYRNKTVKLTWQRVDPLKGLTKSTAPYPNQLKGPRKFKLIKKIRCEKRNIATVIIMGTLKKLYFNKMKISA